MKLKMMDLMRKLNLRMPKQRSDSILYNRWILYALFAIALMNLYWLSVSRHYKYVAMFILIGFLTTFFSKNMVVILFVAIAITNLLQLGLSSSRFEGYEGKEEESEEVEDETTDESSEKKEKKGKASDETPTPDSKVAEKSKDEKIQAKKDQIIEDGKELLDVQAKIVDGFQQIEPYMEKAGTLATEIENSAKTIDQLNKRK